MTLNLVQFLHSNDVDRFPDTNIKRSFHSTKKTTHSLFHQLFNMNDDSHFGINLFCQNSFASLNNI